MMMMTFLSSIQVESTRNRLRSQLRCRLLGQLSCEFSIFLMLAGGNVVCGLLSVLATQKVRNADVPSRYNEFSTLRYRSKT